MYLVNLIQTEEDFKMRRRKFNKVLGTILAISLTLTIAGVLSVLFMIPQQKFYKESGFSMWDMHNNMMSNGGMFGIHGNNNNYNAGMHNNNNNDDNYTNGNMHKGNSRYSNVSENDTLSNIARVDVDNIVDNVEIYQSNDTFTRFEYDGNNTLVAKENGTRLIISDTNKRHNLTTLNKNAGTLRVYIGNTVERIEVKAGVSEVLIDGVSTSNIDAELGLGNFEIKNSQITRKLDVEAGSGNIAINDVESHSIELEIGMGDVTIDSISSVKVEVDGGLGSVNINNSPIDELKTDTGLGNVSVKNSEIKKHRRD